MRQVHGGPRYRGHGGEGTFFDLESLADLQRLETSEQTLAPLRGLVVIDEAQGMPELFPVLQVLLDRPKAPAKFLLTGSASPGWL